MPDKIKGKRMTDLESKLFLFLENIKAEERIDIFLSMMEQNNKNNKTKQPLTHNLSYGIM